MQKNSASPKTPRVKRSARTICRRHSGQRAIQFSAGNRRGNERRCIYRRQREPLHPAHFRRRGFNVRWQSANLGQRGRRRHERAVQRAGRAGVRRARQLVRERREQRHHPQDHHQRRRHNVGRRAQSSVWPHNVTPPISVTSQFYSIFKPPGFPLFGRNIHNPPEDDFQPQSFSKTVSARR